MKQLKIKFQLVLLISMLGIKASAHDIEIKNADGITIYYNYTNNNTELAVSYQGSKNDSYLNEYSGSVVIPESVTYNGIAYSVTSIGEDAFFDCSRLTSITIPNSVTSIGEGAFSGCGRLKSVNIPNSVTSIALAAFELCSSLTSVTIPNSVTSIERGAFNACRRLVSIAIPNSVTSIGNRAFDGTAWYNNQPDGLVYAGKVAYKYKGTMPSNTNIVLEEGTLGIADYAFYNCSGLTSITIPNSVTSIGSYAFELCSSLTSITIPNSVTSIGVRAFNGTAWYNNQPDGLVYAGKVAYSYKGTMPSNTNIILEEGTLGIADYAFYDCSGLTSITIPNSVTSIGNSVFRDCSGLTSVIVEENNPSYDSRSNCNAIVKTATNELIAGCKTTIIPNSVTSIGERAFSGCSGLTSITIPNSVTSIGDYAFLGCSGLTSITIPNSVTSIEEFAFSGCSGLMSVTIPNSVTSIGDYAFERCSALTKVHISDLEAWCKIKFDSNPLYYAHHLYLNGEEVKDLVIPNTVTKIGTYAFSGCSGLTSITIPNSVTSIGDYAFSGCSGLTSITIPNSVTSIGDYAFSDCSGLTSISISNSVTSIGERAFNGTAWYNNQPDGLVYVGKVAYKYKGTMPSNTNIILDKGTLRIADDAFYECSGLTSITIPNSVTSIGRDAFWGCSALTKVHISDLEAWCKIKFDSNPLYYAHHLYLNGEEVKELVIPNSVTSIGDYAFEECSSLTSITIPNSVTSLGRNTFSDCI